MTAPLAFYLGMMVGCFLGILAVSMLVLARRADDKLESPTYDPNRSAPSKLTEPAGQNNNNR